MYGSRYPQAFFHFSNNSHVSSLLLAVLANALQTLDGIKPEIDWINPFCAALTRVYTLCQGSFACAAMLHGRGIVGFRDAHGIKPLMLGERLTRNGQIDYMLSSESCALEKLGFVEMSDIAPGNLRMPTSKGIY